MAGAGYPRADPMIVMHLRPAAFSALVRLMALSFEQMLMLNHATGPRRSRRNVQDVEKGF
jgi:hypothetical protein